MPLRSTIDLCRRVVAWPPPQIVLVTCGNMSSTRPREVVGARLLAAWWNTMRGWRAVTQQDTSMAEAIVSALTRLRVVGLLEGVSFLVLLGIAMPLKYLAGMPEVVRIVGWTHGLLFVAFLAAVAQVARRLRWPYERIAGAVAAALLPFGTFVLDRRLRTTIAELRHPTSVRKIS